MCSVANQSPSQAVMNMLIMDTQVYKQKRQLPLILQKRYQLQLKKMKKMKALLIRNQANTVALPPDSSDKAASQEVDDDNENIDPADTDIGDDIVLLETEADFSDIECSDTVQEPSSPPNKKSKLDEIT